MNNGFQNNGYNEDEYAFKAVTDNGRRRTYGWSIASMVLGILALICCCFGYTSIFFGIFSVVLAIISRRNLGYFDGMSIVGIVLGIIGFIMGVSILVTPLLFDEAMLEEYEKMLEQYYSQSGGTPDL